VGVAHTHPLFEKSGAKTFRRKALLFVKAFV